MNMLLHIQMLTRYNAWANDRLFSTLQVLKEMEDKAAVDGKWSGMLKTLNHASVVDRIWQAHLEARPHGFAARNTDVIPALDTLQAAQESLDAWYIDYASALPAGRYEEMVQFTLIGGNPGIMSRAEILLHVVNHKTYHRGYVAQALYDLGLVPPSMDLPVFIREAGLERHATRPASSD